MNTPGCISRLNLSISIYSSVLVEEMDNVLVRALRCISRLSHTHWEGKPPFTGLFRTYHINFLSNSHQCQTHIKITRLTFFACDMIINYLFLWNTLAPREALWMSISLLLSNNCYIIRGTKFYEYIKLYWTIQNDHFPTLLDRNT